MNFRSTDLALAQPPEIAGIAANAAPAAALAGGYAGRNATPARTADGLSPSWFGGTSPSGATPAATGMWNPFAGDGGALGMIGNLLSAMQSGYEKLLGEITQYVAAQNSCATYSDAEVDSVGDPHISVNGTDASGASVNGHFDSMAGHADLVDANASIPGGYQVSTATTAPDANGITYNQSATVTANNGNDTITFNADGTSSISSNGVPLDVTAGGTVQLDGGETVTKNQDGSLTVNASDGNGNTIATTMSCNGKGVDVKTHASGVALGGDALAQVKGGSAR